MQVSDFELNLIPKIMGVLNVTPDSFSDGGKYFSPSQATNNIALRRAQTMLDEGATFIDVGGESTRPSAAAVSLQQELDRVIPVVEALTAQFGCLVSVDTSSPDVMLEAAAVGASLINDVRALQREGALQAAAKTKLPVCLMHMQGEPNNMQQSPSYLSVIDEVKAFFVQRLDACSKAGVEQQNIILDPGFGFGKTLQHNLQLFNQLDALSIDGLPILIGVSRKSMIGAVLDKQIEQRVLGGVTLAAIAVMKGASIIRTHDVAQTLDAIKIAYAVVQA